MRIFHKQWSAPEQVWKMKRTNISLTEKYKALQKIEEEKSTNESVAEEYGLKKNTISTWIANKRKIFKVYEFRQVNSNPKKLKKSGNKDLEKLLLPGSKIHALITFLLTKLSKRKPWA